MDSKEILENFGISKKFSIILFIQALIVIIGCFLTFQDAYYNIGRGMNLFILIDLITLIVLIFLVYYSFFAFKKNEKYFKVGVYLYIICGILILLIAYEEVTFWNNIGTFIIRLIANLLSLTLFIYFAYNLENYNKAKKAILLVVLVNIILWTLMMITHRPPLGEIFSKTINIIPVVSIALTYFARYTKGGFKQLNK